MQFTCDNDDIYKKNQFQNFLPEPGAAKKDDSSRVY